ncbi:tRNA lysidine(34) synthetase TilS [Luminiphilus sp. nBUS_07]|uniref:tRNA lysidine(34) synthetase TilS n=1 Tax=Luminiphilus sp. nBUS_07 TaxID=3395314 RepID=UPI003EBCF92C
MSGGCDSMVLLHLAAMWRDGGGPAVRAVHVHHGLSQEADAWTELCEKVCQQYSVDLSVYRVCPATDQGKGLEAAARTARYGVYRQHLQAQEVLLLAHHADDQVETVMQRLLRGTGPRGLAGMPRRRALGQGYLSRPLLGVPRSAIRSWAEHHALAYVTDASNLDDRFDRGFLRTQILPKLGQRWPGYRESIRRATTLQADFLRQYYEQPLVLTENAMGEDALAYNANDDSEESRRLLASSLHRWLSEQAVDVPGAVRLTEFVRQCFEARADRCPEIDVGGGVLRAWRGLISFSFLRSEPRPHLAANLMAGECSEVGCGEVTWVLTSGSQGFCPGEAVSVRYRAEGERFRRTGAHTRDFGTLCQAHDVPPWWRSRLPVFCRGETPLYIPLIGALWELEHDEKDGSQRLVPLWQSIKPSPWN